MDAFSSTLNPTPFKITSLILPVKIVMCYGFHWRNVLRQIGSHIYLTEESVYKVY